jgi:NAD-dependent deacetylase
VWEWYKHRKQIIAGIQPNPGHYSVAEMEQYHRSVTVITQNIDGLHQRAGSAIVHELHGNINRNYCTGCGKYFSNEDVLKQSQAPKCMSCNDLIRPDVVWFGEMLPVDVWNASVAVAEHADVFFVVGTSAVVYPAASLPTIARRAGAYVVEINVEQTELTSRVDESLIGKSGEILPRLLALCHPKEIER